MRHFLDINAIDSADLRGIIDSARSIKEARRGRPKGTPDDDQPLAGQIVALIFEKPSTRTRVSFDVGVRQLGDSPWCSRGPTCSSATARRLAIRHACSAATWT